MKVRRRKTKKISEVPETALFQIDEEVEVRGFVDPELDHHLLPPYFYEATVKGHILPTKGKKQPPNPPRVHRRQGELAGEPGGRRGRSAPATAGGRPPVRGGVRELGNGRGVPPRGVVGRLRPATRVARGGGRGDAAAGGVQGVSPHHAGSARVGGGAAAPAVRVAGPALGPSCKRRK